MNANSTLPLSSPSTSLEIRRLSLAAYYAVGSLSVLIWDILYNLAHDYDLFKTHGLDVSSMTYFVSRVSTLALGSVIMTMLTSSVQNCEGHRIAAVVLFNIFTGSTLLLSYIRVCAVWNKSRPVIVVFGFFWLLALVGSLTTAGGITNIDKASICVEVTAKNYVSAAVIAPTVNHVVVFAMITYGLGRHGSRDSILDLKRGYKLYVLGDTLPAFSKALLQTSQMCYLVVVLTGILTVGWFFAYGSDSGYRIAIFSPYTVIVNIMFSWVFRKAKLGVFTVMAPPAQRGSVGFQSARNPRSTVFRPPVFRTTKDLESNNERDDSKITIN